MATRRKCWVLGNEAGSGLLALGLTHFWLQPYQVLGPVDDNLNESKLWNLGTHHLALALQSLARISFLGSGPPRISAPGSGPPEAGQAPLTGAGGLPRLAQLPQSKMGLSCLRSLGLQVL